MVRPGYSRLFEAVALFVDVVGFTPMSEALAAVGRVGSEELTATLNDFFGPAIEILAERGGSVAAFAGDAMTVVFELGPEGADRDQVLGRAVDAALLIQDHTRRCGRVDTSAGTFDLTVRAGAASGDVLLAVVGNQARWHGYTAGSAISAATAAEGAARSGDVVVPADAAPALSGHRLAPVVDGYLRALPGEVPPAPASRSSPLGCGSPTGERFVPRAVSERVRAGGDAFVEEHRRITTVFANFVAPDPSSVTAADDLQDYVEEVLALVDRHEGCMTQIQSDDKGSSFLVVFGAPSAHDDDESRAISCASAIAALEGRPPRIGVTTGTAFCGRVGSPDRRTYTVMGDCVNLAARLMQAAEPGDVLVDDATRSRATAFAWSDPWAVKVKGKDFPVVVARHVEGDAAMAGPSPGDPVLPLVGRADELRMLASFVGGLGARRNNLLVLRGAAGTGKTRIAHEGAARAAARGFRVVEGRCDPYGTETPYLPWTSMWRSLLGLDSTADAATVVEALVERAPGVQDLRNRAPLLAGLLGYSIPDTPLTVRLSPELRSELMQSVLAEILGAMTTDGEVVFLIEDAQWIDPASRDLLIGLVRATAARPVGYVVTARTPEDAALARSLSVMEGATWIEVEGLDDDVARTLIRQKAAASGLPALDDQTMAKLLERTGGTPLFIEAVLDLAAQSGSDLATVVRADLPEGLRSAVLARLDRLSETDKVLLKLASVVGREFPLSWLTGAFPAVGGRADIESRVDRLGRLGFAHVVEDVEPAWRFAHAAYQEVAYEAISFETRRRLHGDVGAHIESVSGADLTQHVELLAHHFGLTEDADRQRRYFSMAATKAKAAYANESALGWLERLRPLLEGDAADEVAVDAGEVRVILGEWDEATVDFNSVGDSPRIRSQAARHLGNLLTLQCDYTSALATIGEACALARGTGDTASLMRALDALGRAQVFLADYPAARESASEHLELARRADDPAETGAALENLALVEWALGDLDAAAGHLLAALDAGRQVGDLVLVAHSANDLAGVYDASGSMDRCVETLAVSAEAARRLGYRHHLGVITGNEADLRLSRGDSWGALACALSAISTLADLGDRTGVVRNIGIVATGLAAQGRAGDGEALLRRAVEAGTGESYHRAENLVALGQMVLDRGDARAATEVLQHGLETAEAAGNEPAVFNASLLLRRAEVDTGSRTVADALDALEELGSDLDDPGEHAAVAYETWRLTGAPSHGLAAARALRDAHESTPLAQYRIRHREITGDGIPDPPPLPEVIVLEQVPEVADVDAYLAELESALAVLGV